jgi:hypothetical protein
MNISQYSQLHDYLSQIIGLSNKDGLPKITQGDIAKQLSVDSSGVCRFINKKTLEPEKMLKNFKASYPLEFERWPKGQEKIGKTLQKIDAITFLKLPHETLNQTKEATKGLTPRQLFPPDPPQATKAEPLLPAQNLINPLVPVDQKNTTIQNAFTPTEQHIVVSNSRSAVGILPSQINQTEVTIPPTTAGQNQPVLRSPVQGTALPTPEPIFSSIYTNYGTECKNTDPFSGLVFVGLKEGGVSSPPEIQKIEVEKVEEFPAERYNTDLALIASIHPHYLLKRMGSEKFNQDLKDKHQSVVGRDVKSLPKAHPLGEGTISLVKEIVLAKAFFLQYDNHHQAVAQKRNYNKIVLCFAGHWVDKSDIQGEHAYPSSQIWMRLHQIALRLLPDTLKTNAGNLNRIAWEVHHFDARNLIGFCKSCNQKKGEKSLINWVKSNQYYGQEFVDSILPLSNHVVPRTKDGEGLGDAMISHFFMKRNSLTLLADAPLLNTPLVLSEFKVLNRLTPEEIGRLQQNADTAAEIGQLLEVCALFSANFTIPKRK